MRRNSLNQMQHLCANMGKVTKVRPFADYASEKLLGAEHLAAIVHIEGGKLLQAGEACMEWFMRSRSVKCERLEWESKL